MRYEIPMHLKLPVKIKIEPTEDNFDEISTKVSLESSFVQNNPESEPLKIKIEPEAYFKEPGNPEHLKAKVKREYVSDEESTPKSLVLRFKRDEDGNYSVIPLIKPDPFFEELIDDVSEEENNCPITMEQTYSFNTAENISNGHIKKINIIKCKFCLYTHTEANVKKHISRVHGNKMISCPFCTEKSFKVRDSLDSHLLKKHSNQQDALAIIKRKIWECQLCLYKTIVRSNFTRHLITHENKLKNKNIKTMIQKDIRKAVEGKVQYDCHHCSYGTYDKGAITKHVRIHKGKNYMPHKCAACSLTFNELKSLDSHILKRHYDNKDVMNSIRDKIIKCEHCNYRDISKTKLLRHKSARHIKKEKRGRKAKNEW
ncbi:zinc finger Y-chromosomal protein-like isoform X2 [Anthonomus grandis grandis]|nr:zinc finger Y-chromosomal protein-like isoform X2 [Anthonomus grandis grandis]